MRKVLITILILMLAGVGTLRAATISIPLNDPRDVDPNPYIVDVPWVAFDGHSVEYFELENTLDPTRYKDWDFKVAIPAGSPAVVQIDTLSYFLDAGKTTSLDIPNIDLD